MMLSSSLLTPETTLAAGWITKNPSSVSSIFDPQNRILLYSVGYQFMRCSKKYRLIMMKLLYCIFALRSLCLFVCPCALHLCRFQPHRYAQSAVRKVLVQDNTTALQCASSIEGQLRYSLNSDCLVCMLTGSVRAAHSKICCFSLTYCLPQLMLFVSLIAYVHVWHWFVHVTHTLCSVTATFE